MNKMKKLLCIMLSVILALSVSWLPCFSEVPEINSGQTEIPDEDLNGDSGQKHADVSFSEVMEQTKLFDYIDRAQFEKEKHVARITPLESLNTYVFANEDGTNTVYMLSENVKYISENGSRI